MYTKLMSELQADCTVCIGSLLKLMTELLRLGTKKIEEEFEVHV